MLTKIVLVFLLFMVVLAVFGRFRFPGQERIANLQCKDCGRYRIGKGPCQCKTGGQR